MTLFSRRTGKPLCRRRPRGLAAVGVLLSCALTVTLWLGAAPDAQAAPYGFYSGTYDYFGGYERPRNRSWQRSRKRRARRARGRRTGAASRRRSAYKPAKVVPFDKKYKKGTIVINTSRRELFYVLRPGEALRYTVAVGKPGMQWSGKTFVQLKRKNPGWTPTARMRREGAPAYVPPGPRNPLGVRAINLGWSEYRIHGTNAPNSIGRAVSSGCIRMRNSDVKDLFDRVHIGAPVYVIR